VIRTSPLWLDVSQKFRIPFPFVASNCQGDRDDVRELNDGSSFPNVWVNQPVLLRIIGMLRGATLSLIDLGTGVPVVENPRIRRQGLFGGCFFFGLGGCCT
jgi:hypothetical protein